MMKVGMGTAVGGMVGKGTRDDKVGMIKVGNGTIGCVAVDVGALVG